MTEVNEKSGGFHARSPEDVLKALDSDESGLSEEEAKQRREKYGPNELKEKKLPSLWQIVLRQFLNPLIYVLLAAAVVSLVLEETSDAVFIFAVLLFNAAIGAFEEYTAQQSASALKRMVEIETTVIRGDEARQIDAKDVVPGDIVRLTSGDKVPADIRLLSARELSVDESLLTGESEAVSKDAEAEPEEDASLGDRITMAFAGTMVAGGRGRGVVVATADDTEIGKIAESVSAPDETRPPLMVRIDKFTVNISLVMAAVIALMVLMELVRGESMVDVFMLAVALAVCAIPVGLPAALTVALSISMRRMAERNVIIRRLMAVESLGSCTFIASDKTGTMTVNQLTAVTAVLADASRFKLKEQEKLEDEALRPLLRTAVLANEGTYRRQDEPGEVEKHGDEVDVALLAMGAKAEMWRDEMLEEYPEEANIPYESKHAYSASLHQSEEGLKVYVKGSAERVLEMCTDVDREAQLKQAEELAAEGVRVLAFAEGEYDGGELKEEKLEGLTFLGIVGMADPLREEVPEAVQKCRDAGIEVAMITGDHPVTARAIARQLKLDCEDDCVVTGRQLRDAEKEGEEAIDRLTEHGRVFARIEPSQKKQIVESLIRHGHFLAVTGDGVNDAPALHAAHVGVAMGKSGTDVARESSDMILADDNFASIVNGIEEGRVVYGNIRKVVYMLVATGIAEICFFLPSIFLGMPLPLVAVQLLWLNLIAEGVQSIGFAFEPAEGDELKKPPRPPDEPIFNRLMIERIAVSALFMGATAFGVFKGALMLGYELDAARNLTLLYMILFENIQVFNSRSETRSVFSFPLLRNPLLVYGTLAVHVMHLLALHVPFMQDVLGMQPVSLAEWGALFGLSLLILAVGELHKWLRRDVWRKT